MYILSIKNRKSDGAYAVKNDSGEKVLFIFEDIDDATRYALMLKDYDDIEMDVIEVDNDMAIKTCQINNYKYAVITPNDIVIPPKNDNI